MKAMIFAAGLGTRLKPLTDTMPKALVTVGGKPLLQHTIEKLKAAGFDEIIINVHHFADQIIDFVAANHHFDIHIEFSDEREKLLDTGGGIKKASPFFNDNKPFLVHNVDILSNIDLRKLYETHMRNNLTSPVPPTVSPILTSTIPSHISPTSPSTASPSFPSSTSPTASPVSPQSGPDAPSHTNTRLLQNEPLSTLVCSERKTSRYLLFDNNNRLKGWINEKTGEVKSPFPDFDHRRYKKLAFAGIHVLQPTVFNYMDSFPARFSIIDFYLSICDKVGISCYIPGNLKLVDVGKPESLEEAAQFLEQITR